METTGIRGKLRKKRIQERNQKATTGELVAFGTEPWKSTALRVCACIRNVQEKIREMQGCSVNFNEQRTTYYRLQSNIGDMLCQNKTMKYVIYTFWNVSITQAEHM